MEGRDHGQHSIRFDDEHQSIREAAQQGAADVPVNDRKLPGIGAHALDRGVNRRAETQAQAGALVLIPILRVDQLGASCEGKDNR